MQTLAASECPEFWADTYCGRPIAVLNRQGRWHVYLDHALQHNVLFATAEEAIAWLTQRVDRPAPEAMSLPQ